MKARFALPVLAAILGLGSVGQAYVRSQTSTGVPIEWRNECADLVLTTTENPEFPHARLIPLLERAADNWNHLVTDCTKFHLALSPETAEDLEVGFDGENIVIWRLGDFCADPDNSVYDVCLAPNAAAVTTVFFVDTPGHAGDGELLEGDLAINGARFQFADDGSPDRVDLESVMTHEMGHFLGLGHSCHAPNGRPPPLDSEGNEAPRCFPTSGLPTSVTDAMMFSFLTPGEIKHTPLADEARGICEVYAGHSGECSDERGSGGCGCRAGGPASGPNGAATLALLLIGAGILTRMTRKRRP